MPETLFDLDDFTETSPVTFHDWYDCGIHDRHREDDEHARDCWHNACPCCGDEVANGWMMRLNHDLGWRFGPDGTQIPPGVIA